MLTKYYIMDSVCLNFLDLWDYSVPLPLYLPSGVIKGSLKTYFEVELRTVNTEIPTDFKVDKELNIVYSPDKRITHILVGKKGFLPTKEALRKLDLACELKRKQPYDYSKGWRRLNPVKEGNIDMIPNLGIVNLCCQVATMDGTDYVLSGNQETTISLLKSELFELPCPIVRIALP